MRIRRRVADAPPSAQAASSSRTGSPPALAPSSPARASAPCLETAEGPSAREANRSTCEEVTDDHRLPSQGWNRQQEEVKEEKDTAAENEKRGENEDERSGHEHGLPVHVVCGNLTGAAPKREEEEERRAEVDEAKREDPERANDAEKTTLRFCKKGDGKGWRCKRAALTGYSLCQYHLDKLRSYSCYSRKKKKLKTTAALPGKSLAAGNHSPRAPPRQQQKRSTEGCVPSARPGASDSFYYYSGFGPRWGKRRGDRSSDGVKPPDGGASGQVHPHDDMAAAAGETVAEEAVVVEEEDYDCDGDSRDEKPPKSRRLSTLL